MITTYKLNHTLLRPAAILDKDICSKCSHNQRNDDDPCATGTA